MPPHIPQTSQIEARLQNLAASQLDAHALLAQIYGPKSPQAQVTQPKGMLAYNIGRIY